MALTAIQTQRSWAVTTRRDSTKPPGVRANIKVALNNPRPVEFQPQLAMLGPHIPLFVLAVACSGTHLCAPAQLKIITN